MKLPFFLLSIFYLVATAVNSRKTGGGYREAILSCNNYIDSMIQDVLDENGDYFDPHPINASLLTFHKKVVFIDFKGEAKLTEGYISGLRNLHRVSSCSLSFEQGRLKVSAKLEIEKLLFNFTGSVKAININKALIGKGATSKVYLSTGISLDADGKESVLEDLNVDYVSNVTLDVEGMLFLGWMEEPTKINVALFFKALTEKLVEVQMKKLMAERMKEKPFSLEKFDLDIGDLEVTTTEGDVLIGELVHSKEDADSYIDNVLENRFQLEAEYSKLSQKDFISDDRIDNVYVSNATNNYLLLKNGHLENLTKLRRTLDCSHPVLRSSNITFICYLGFPRLKFYYVAESHDGDTISSFDIVALVDDTRLDVKITTTVKDNIPSMLDLKVNNVGKITVKVAHTIADAPSMQVASRFNKDVIKNHFAEKLKEILLGKLKDVLGYSIYKTPIHFIDGFSKYRIQN